MQISYEISSSPRVDRQADEVSTTQVANVFIDTKLTTDAEGVVVTAEILVESRKVCADVTTGREVTDANPLSQGVNAIETIKPHFQY